MSQNILKYIEIFWTFSKYLEVPRDTMKTLGTNILNLNHLKNVFYKNNIPKKIHIFIHIFLVVPDVPWKKRRCAVDICSVDRLQKMLCGEYDNWWIFNKGRECACNLLVCYSELCWLNSVSKLRSHGAHICTAHVYMYNQPVDSVPSLLRELPGQ